MSTPSPAPRLVLRHADLAITELVTPDDRLQQAASTLAAQLARTVLEFLQRHRSRATLARVVRPELAEQLDEWRRLVDWRTTRLLSARGTLVTEHVVEASFTVLRAGRHRTFVARLRRDGRQWSCVHLAPVGLLVPARHGRGH